MDQSNDNVHNEHYETYRDAAHAIGSSTATLQTQERLLEQRTQRFCLCHNLLGSLNTKYINLSTDLKKLLLNMSEVKKLNGTIFDATKSRLIQQIQSIRDNANNQSVKFQRNYDSFINLRHEQCSLVEDSASLLTQLHQELIQIQTLESSCKTVFMNLQSILSHAISLNEQLNQHTLQFQQFEQHDQHTQQQITSTTQQYNHIENDQSKLKLQIEQSQSQVQSITKAIEGLDQEINNMVQSLLNSSHFNTLHNIINHYSNLDDTTPLSPSTISSFRDTLSQDQTNQFESSNQHNDLLQAYHQSPHSFQSNLTKINSYYSAMVQHCNTQLQNKSDQLNHLLQHSNEIDQQIESLTNECEIISSQKLPQIQVQIQQCDEIIIQLNELIDFITSYYGAISDKERLNNEYTILCDEITNQSNNIALLAQLFNNEINSQTHIDQLAHDSNVLQQSRSDLNTLLSTNLSIPNNDNDRIIELQSVFQTHNNTLTTALSQQQTLENEIRDVVVELNQINEQCLKLDQENHGYADVLAKMQSDGNNDGPDQSHRIMIEQYEKSSKALQDLNTQVGSLSVQYDAFSSQLDTILSSMDSLSPTEQQTQLDDLYKIIEQYLSQSTTVSSQ